MATDYLGMLGQAGNAWYGEKKFDEAQDNIQEGFSDAKQAVTEYGQPYTDFGLENINNFQNQGDFSFSNEDFYNDPSYQFRLDESMKQTQRSAAGRGMLNSTNTLNSLTERAGDLASQEYQAAFERAKGTYETNMQKNQFGIQIGADMAKNLGDNLADIGIGQGIALAQLNGMQMQRMNDLITSTLAAAGQPSDPNTVSGMINDAISTGVSTVGDFLGGLVGDAAGAIGGALGIGGAATAASGGTAAAGSAGYNALQGGYGSLSTILGEGAAGGFTGSGVHAGFGGASTTAAATQSFGAWAGTALGGVAALMAVRSIVDALRGPSQFQELTGELAKSDDPLGDIAGWDYDKLQTLVGYQGDEKYTVNLSKSAAKGMLYSSVLKSVEPEDMQAIRMHDDVGLMSSTMMSALQAQEYKDGANPLKALTNIYPELKDDFQEYNELAALFRSNEYSMATEADTGGTGEITWKMYGYENESHARDVMTQARRALNTQMSQYQTQWSAQRAAGDLMMELQGGA